MSPFRPVIDRFAGIAILLTIPLLAATVVVDPGYSTEPEYVARSIARFLPEREQFMLGVALMLALAVASLAAGATMLLIFLHVRASLAGASAVGLLAAGLLILGGTAAGFRIDQLVTEWLTSPASADADVERSALSVGQLRFVFAGLGFVLLLISLICSGVVIHRVTMLPRWLLRIPVVSGVVMAGSPLGFRERWLVRVRRS